MWFTWLCGNPAVRSSRVILYLSVSTPCAADLSASNPSKTTNTYQRKTFICKEDSQPPPMSSI